MIMLMNIHTGTVAPESEWRAEYARMTNEEWGSVVFNDGSLVEVVRGCNGEFVETPKFVSFDNGNSYHSHENLDEVEEKINEDWDYLVSMMDDDTRETVHCYMNLSCSNKDFLREYLILAPMDLIIG